MKIAEFLRRFHDDKSCRQHFESFRWPAGPVCPSCGAVNNAVATRRSGLYRCRDCSRHFSVTVGTVMEGTHLPLNVWYHAMYLILASSNAITGLKLAQQLGRQHRTAWHLTRRIRAMLKSGDEMPVAGLIEVDEPDDSDEWERFDDAWERFEKAVDTVVKAGPQHRTRTVSAPTQDRTHPATGTSAERPRAKSR
jgi:transposase-like protein